MDAIGRRSLWNSGLRWGGVGPGGGRGRPKGFFARKRKLVEQQRKNAEAAGKGKPKR